MRLAELVASETGIAIEHVMLLRHSNSTVHKLVAAGGSIEEYTSNQPTGSRYDYMHPTKPPTNVVVVIVNDAVYGVYRVLQVAEEGTTYSLASAAHRRFDQERGKAERPARRFLMDSVQSVAVGLPVTGWEGRSRTTVQRVGDGFFSTVEVDALTVPVDAEVLSAAFSEQVQKSIAGGSAARRKRLALASKLPRVISTTSRAYARNPDVVAEVLLRADGVCELCGSSAPFIRRSDGSPYLEVHHRIRLADRGEDTVENAVAVCPNCHRREHYS